MAKKRKKEISISDKNIISELKKNRLFSKTKQVPIDNLNIYGTIEAYIEDNKDSIKYILLTDRFLNDFNRYLLSDDTLLLYIDNDNIDIDDLYKYLTNKKYNVIKEIKFKWKSLLWF